MSFSTPLRTGDVAVPLSGGRGVRKFTAVKDTLLKYQKQKVLRYPGLRNMTHQQLENVLLTFRQHTQDVYGAQAGSTLLSSSSLPPQKFFFFLFRSIQNQTNDVFVPSIHFSSMYACMHSMMMSFASRPIQASNRQCVKIPAALFNDFRAGE